MNEMDTSQMARQAATELVEIGWKQKAMAECYVHSPLPSLVRPFRDRYRLTRNRGGRRVSIQRRIEPSGRILYYHRVNDDNDPFFPAISTELFEQEMRFLRKHYTVVSLAELTNRLAGNSQLQ